MSWILIPYFAGIADNVRQTLIGMTFLNGLVSILLVCTIIAISSNKYSEEKEIKIKDMSAKVIKWSIPIFFLTWSLQMLIPSKETVFQMAGFGAAETVIKSDTANKAVELANEYLTKQLKQLKQENK
jgi:hypothetical protein